MRLPKVSVLVLLALLILGVPAEAGKSEDLAKTLMSEGDPKSRIKAGIELAASDPMALLPAVEKIVKSKRADDTEILAEIAVQTKVMPARWLLVWAAGKLGGAGPAFRDLIDNDHPHQSERAIEAIGLLKDTTSIERLLVLVRSKNEIVAVAAARALGRMGNKKLAGELVQLSLGLDNKRVRTHIAWSVQDLLGSRKAAGGMYARYARKKGTEGFRATEALGLIDDETAEVMKYKTKLETVRNFFKMKRGLKAPEVDGPTEQIELVKKVLNRLKDDAPDYYHLIASTVKEIKVSGDERIMDHEGRVLNLRHRDVVNWNREELWSYYIVRYVSIMFGGQMGESVEKQRGWEPGCLMGWQYAMDHAYESVAVKEDPVEFIHGIIKMRPPPW